MNWFSRDKAKETGKAVAVEATMQGATQIAAMIEAATGVPVSLLLEAGMTLQEIIDAAEENGGLMPNPYLMMHGLGDGPSPATKRYLNIRKAKKIGGAVYSIVGTGVQAGLDVAGFGMGGVDVFGLAKHGTSEVSTLAHLVRLAALAKRVRQSEYLQALVLDMIKVKTAKATVRGGKIAAAAIPNTIASNAVSITVSLGAAALQVMIKELVDRVACQIHWRAYQELTIGRVHGGGYGPAASMAQEVMNHIVSHSFAPGDDTRKFLLEPAGYVVLRDKLSML